MANDEFQVRPVSPSYARTFVMISCLSLLPTFHYKLYLHTSRNYCCTVSRLALVTRSPSTVYHPICGANFDTKYGAKRTRGREAKGLWASGIMIRISGIGSYARALMILIKEDIKVHCSPDSAHIREL